MCLYFNHPHHITYNKLTKIRLGKCHCRPSRWEYPRILCRNQVTSTAKWSGPRNELAGRITSNMIFGDTTWRCTLWVSPLSRRNTATMSTCTTCLSLILASSSPKNSSIHWAKDWPKTAWNSLLSLIWGSRDSSANNGPCFSKIPSETTWSSRPWPTLPTSSHPDLHPQSSSLPPPQPFPSHFRRILIDKRANVWFDGRLRLY